MEPSAGNQASVELASAALGRIVELVALGRIFAEERRAAAALAAAT